jgi:hypothetical protein
MIVTISSVTAAANAITAPSLNQQVKIWQARGKKPNKKPAETPSQTTETLLVAIDPTTSEIFYWAE